MDTLVARCDGKTYYKCPLCEVWLDLESVCLKCDGCRDICCECILE